MQAVTIKKMIAPIRKKQARYGTEKLYLDLAPQLKKTNIKMGRIDDAKHFLELSGTDYLRMYPDFEGFAKQMTDKYNQLGKTNI